MLGLSFLCAYLPNWAVNGHMQCWLLLRGRISCFLLHGCVRLHSSGMKVSSTVMRLLLFKFSFCGSCVFKVQCLLGWWETKGVFWECISSTKHSGVENSPPHDCTSWCRTVLGFLVRLTAWCCCWHNSSCCETVCLLRYDTASLASVFLNLCKNEQLYTLVYVNSWALEALCSSSLLEVVMPLVGLIMANINLRLKGCC